MQVPTFNLIIGIVLAVLIALILLGGIKRIGQVTEKLVPFMAVLYIILATWRCSAEYQKCSGCIWRRSLKARLIRHL